MAIASLVAVEVEVELAGIASQSQSHFAVAVAVVVEVVSWSRSPLLSDPPSTLSPRKRGVSMSRFGCVVCGEPVEPGQDTCSEDCELVQDAAVCPECSHAVEPFSWHTGAPLRSEAHAAGCSRVGDDLALAAPR